MDWSDDFMNPSPAVQLQREQEIRRLLNKGREIPSGITPSESQKAAIAKAVQWYRRYRHQQQVFRLYGFAGVGKTTIAKWVIAELGLSSICAATLTGKAALVMQRNGLPAQTVHSLIYVYIPADPAAVKQAEDDYKQAVKSGVIDDDELNQMKQQIKAMKQPIFVLNEASKLRGADLLVLDECSMLDVKAANDLLSFGVPILLIGDPGQLPPPQGHYGFDITAEPDVFLTEIHRQALDSPIIRLATMARQGKPIPFGTHGEAAFKLPRKEVPIALYTSVDQIITGYNKTRINLNNMMRQHYGFTQPMPTGPAEKIIVTRNKHSLNLLNGQFIKVHEPTKLNEYVLAAKLDTGEYKTEIHVQCYTGNFLDHVTLDKQRHDKDWQIKKTLVELDFGYAITCHKAQGSGFGKVMVVDDKWNLGGDRNKWLYTAITRAEEILVIAA